MLVEAIYALLFIGGMALGIAGTLYVVSKTSQGVVREVLVASDELNERGEGHLRLCPRPKAHWDSANVVHGPRVTCVWGVGNQWKR